jgi:hypothetical protein
MPSAIPGQKGGIFQMQRSTRTTLIALTVLILSLVALMTPLGAAQGRQVAALSPKPAQLTPYAPPHKPHWKLSDVLAQNTGKQSWTVTVVDDAHLKAQ